MAIEFNIVRGILTLVLMLSFITLVVWLYGKRHKHTFDYAAQMPLEDDVPDSQSHAGQQQAAGKGGQL
jgi:cytochrome c oxidase cbb3-type subunit IV